MLPRDLPGPCSCESPKAEEGAGVSLLPPRPCGICAALKHNA